MSDAWCQDCGEQGVDLTDYYVAGVPHRLCQWCLEAWQATAPPECPEDDDEEEEEEPAL